MTLPQLALILVTLGVFVGASDVPARAWPGSPGFGLALGGSGFTKR